MQGPLRSVQLAGIPGGIFLLAHPTPAQNHLSAELSNGPITTIPPGGEFTWTLRHGYYTVAPKP